MPEIDMSKFEAMQPHDLELARQAVVNRNRGIDSSEWSDDDLSELVAIVTVLRRRVSGPPKARTGEGGETVKPARAKKTKASLEDLA